MSIYERVPDPPSPTGAALGIDVVNVSKRFGSVQALTDVSISVKAGTFHALLGENGAGKSTLVKCLVGYQRGDTGSVVVNGRETEISNPRIAHMLGIGMVYQHFTVSTGMTVAENLMLAGGEIPTIVNWRKEKAQLREFLATTPFKLDLDALVGSLAAGEKQKLEILKQLYLKRRFLILDEPTSVLTPGEADEILGLLRDMTRRGELTVLMISHKFREVMAFCDEVSVLRKGKFIGSGKVGELSAQQMADMMVEAGAEAKAAGGSALPEADAPAAPQAVATPSATTTSTSHADRSPVASDAPSYLKIDSLKVINDKGSEAVRGITLNVKRGEIVGIAGVSGNGQKELVEALLGQRNVESGQITVKSEPYRATRAEMRRHKLFSLPEEPLRNACVGDMSIAENIALRNFDQTPIASGWRLRRSMIKRQAEKLIIAFNVKPPKPELPIRALSGGNVQRAVLARELSGDVDVLIVANPVFGLDFAAVAEIHSRLVDARNKGAAILLVSEDLDELLELSDRLMVISEGQIVHETVTATADTAVIGRSMAGAH